MPMTNDQADALLRPGETCWRVARASRAALIVDAAEYFLHLRTALTDAEWAVYLIGWDFDLRIEMVPGQSDEDGNAPNGLPNRLGDFLEALVDRRPHLHLHILKWNGAMFAEIASQAWETLRLKMASKNIRFALDSHHPAGASHHQKIVVIDDCLAFCGGIDVTAGRWDTCTTRSVKERCAPDREGGGGKKVTKKGRSAFHRRPFAQPRSATAISNSLSLRQRFFPLILMEFASGRSRAKCAFPQPKLSH